MNPKTADHFIRFFALKYFSQILPPEVLEALADTDDTLEQDPDIVKHLAAWDTKISIQSHWEGVIEDKQSDKDLANLSLYKYALFNERQLLIEFQDNEKKTVIFNPFGLVIRNENFFFVGSFTDSQEPVLLSQSKIINVQLDQQKALKPPPDFNLAHFAETYLNHPVIPAVIDTLVAEFPMKSYYYVKSHPIKCEELCLSEPPDTPGYFRLIAKNVANSIRLHQWFSGFQDDAQIIEPDYLRKLINRSYVDQLTNLYNRKAFDRLGHREIELCFRYPLQIFSLLIIDIDHFKNINDRHGHIFGDDVLIKVSECLRDYDAIRFGGEEFVILLSNTHAENAKKVAERIRNAIAKLILNNDQGKQVPVTISLGIAEFPKHLSMQDQKSFCNHGKVKFTEKEKNGLMMAITNQADKALYRAKSSGRNQSIIYQEGD